jgi:hypothetical protein
MKAKPNKRHSNRSTIREKHLQRVSGARNLNRQSFTSSLQSTHATSPGKTACSQELAVESQ